MEKLKILFCGPFDIKGRHEGGISFIVNSIMDNIDLCEEQNLVLDTFDVCRIERKVIGQGQIGFRNIINTFYLIKDLRKESRNNKYDVIYYNSSYGMALLKDLIVILLSECKKRSRVVIHIHFADADKLLPVNKFFRKVTMWLLINTINHVVFLSKKTRDVFIQRGLSKENTSVIYNFHDIKMTDVEAKVKAEKIPLKSQRELLFIGSIDQRKGILDLLEALKSVSIPYHLSICGKAIEKNIETLVSEKIAILPKNSVELKGFVRGKQKEDVLKNTDLLILPSYAEGFPIVLLEGIAASCGIISTSIGAIPEVFDNKNGAILEPGDIKGLTDAILSCCEEKRLMSCMKNNYLLSQKFNMKSFIIELKRVCESV